MNKETPGKLSKIRWSEQVTKVRGGWHVSGKVRHVPDREEKYQLGNKGGGKNRARF